MPIENQYGQLLAELDSQKFRTLRPSQDNVLREYSANFKEVKDVAVELPTGAGKTLIALLIAEEFRRRGEKVAILSANKTLARQMLRESEELGIPSVIMEGRGADIPTIDKRKYHRSRAIAIMNYWVYFNQNPAIDAADLLIMDDAHLAEHCLHSLYSVEITRFQHKELFETLVSELHERFPEYAVLSDAVDSSFEDSQPPELLSFIDQVVAARRIQEIIQGSSEIKTDVDLQYRWGRMRGSLNEANIYLARNSLWIRPYIYPLFSNPHCEGAKQRIYMSATIGDPGDLGRRLGIKDISKIPVPDEYSESTFGRRLILMNRIEQADIPTRLGSAILTALKIHPKSVWLCSSADDAVKYKGAVDRWLAANHFEGHPSWILTPEGDEIDKFKQSSQGHLFVAGRFDGMDFNGDEYRLVILTTLPRAINTQEEFISAYLRDSGFMRERLNQRVIQALGRCNRDDRDFAVYVLADRRFPAHFGLESNKVALPPNLIAELDMGQDAAELETSLLCDRVKEFLSGDFSTYDQQLDDLMSGAPRTKFQPKPRDTSSHEVLGWNAMFQSQNYGVAQESFEKCWDAAKEDGLLEIGALHGWHRAKALFLQSLLHDANARHRAFEVLEAAIKRGGQCAWFNRMRGSLNRAREASGQSTTPFEDDYFLSVVRGFDEFLDACGTSGSRFEQQCNRLVSLLNSDHHNEFQEGLKQLGALLGYGSNRPKGSGATDCLWKGIFGSSREIFTFEAKIEHSPSNKISLKDIGQAHNQENAADSYYSSQGFVVHGIIITHLDELEPGAEPALGGIRLISKQATKDLWVSVRSLLATYRGTWSPDNLATRLSAAQSIRSRVPEAGWLTRALAETGPFLGTKEVTKEWLS